MKEKERFVVDEYSFGTKAEWEEAKREEESIQYIRAKTNLSDPQTVYKVYCGLVEKKTFTTPVGTAFLLELRAGLLRAGKEAGEIPGIPVTLPRRKKKSAEDFSRELEDKSRLLLEQCQVKLRNMRIVTFFLGFVIVVMFLIAVFGPNSPLEDAEVKAQNKYAAWEQELKEREDAVKEKERELGITR
ncbi:MAG: hypothetical protein HFG79_06805 [Lachnospiraceae bacterium]|jgi:Na+-transporting methylmalonyl-CoA/oxaloacetate decarboxylase gamma subunit|nr:hypothetical protein [Lachnospiraceae bacterium]